MNNREVLNAIVEDYKQLNEVEAIVLSGSSTVKNDDNASDYDIYIYCTEEPPVEKRRKIALKYSVNPEIDNHNFETGDVYYLKTTGKPIDIMYRSLESIQNNIKNVWHQGNASLGYTTCIIYNVNKAKILFDRDGKFIKIQNLTKTLYPDKLRKNIIKKNFLYLKDAMFSYYDQLKSAVNRGDLISVNHRTAAFIAGYFDAIFAYNRVLNPGEKKLVEFALKNCKVLPQNFKEDINVLAVGAVYERLKTAENMVENLRKILSQE